MDSILRQLQAFSAPDVFNPWSQTDSLDTHPAAAEARCDRLRSHFSCSPALILVGEAPGYQGCHFSGVAFTNEKLILDGTIPRVRAPSRITSRPRPWCEPSATIVWRTLHELQIADRVVLWNAFAWHPHKPGDRLSNRTPTRAEVQSGAHLLKSVLEHFDGVPVVPVGQVAAKALSSLGVSAFPHVRHPSMGGATAFRSGMIHLAGHLSPPLPAEDEQLPLAAI